MTLFLY